MEQKEALWWIAEIFQEVPDRVGVKTPREDIPGWDSLGVLSLMAEMDETFDIQLEEEQLTNMQTVNDILEILRNNGILNDG